MLSPQSPDALLVLANAEASRAQAASWAERLGVACHQDVDPKTLSADGFALLFDERGVVLQQTGHKAPGPIRVDFVSGAADHRRKFGGGKGQMIAKAVGVKSGVYPQVLDVTAGLGRDAYVLASLGCDMTLLERSPVVQALLADGLQRARDYSAVDASDIAAILGRMQFHPQDSLAYLQDAADVADVVYLDPMFPARHKTADIKKEMKAFHSVVGQDLDADALLAPSLAAARYRVVVKRPRKAPYLAERTPSYQLQGKSSRYDIYTLQKMPAKLPLVDEV